MNLFNVAAKTASILALATVAVDSHDMGRRNSKKEEAQVSVDKFVSDSISASKLNSTSSRHNSIKTFLANSDITDKFAEFGGKIGGYISGFGQGIWNNIFLAAFGAVGLTAKSKPVKTIAMIGMGLSLIVDTIINATGIFDRKDYLDK